jgi:mRNA interferase YafQ
MTLKIKNAKQFKKDLKRFLHQKQILKDLENVIKALTNEETLDLNLRDHPLIGNWVGYRECHVRGDLLLIYKVDKEENMLYLAAFGSHAELLAL